MRRSGLVRVFVFGPPVFTDYMPLYILVLTSSTALTTNHQIRAQQTTTSNAPDKNVNSRSVPLVSLIAPAFSSPQSLLCPPRSSSAKHKSGGVSCSARACDGRVSFYCPSWTWCVVD